MKHILTTALITLAGVAFTGCNDLLDDNRYPETSITNNPTYWSNSDNTQMQVNRFYQYFYGYGSGGTLGNFYFNTLTDDQASGTGGSFVNWKNTSVPASSTNYSTPYVVIRGCNYIIEGVNSSSLSESQKANFIGQARLIRGYYYYLLTRRYGDVPLVTEVLDPESEELYGPRTSRKEVIDFAYDDMYYASQNITAQSGKQEFTKDLANAMLSDMCLWEGTFWKYCNESDNGYAPDTERSNTYLTRCVQASQSLISSYPISSDYAKLYNSSWSNSAYGTLNNNSEVIFGCEYVQSSFMHSTIAYTCSSTSIAGLSKDAFDSYLFLDGKPKALTSYDTSDLGVPVLHMEGATVSSGETQPGPGLSIKNLLAVRDQRLAATTDTVVYYNGMSWERAGSNQMTSSSGYGVRKYDNPDMPADERVTTAKNFTSCPLYWGAVVCLNYAEAKAELGTLDDNDMNMTLNKLYARAGLPDQTVSSLTSMNDPDNNMGVSSLIWEVRRCRRCELIMDNDYRYWDLNRWHKLDLLDTTEHPNIVLGANVSNSYVQADHMTGDYINASNGGSRAYESRQYLYPIPSGQITLNPALTQNPGW